MKLILSASATALLMVPIVQAADSSNPPKAAQKDTTKAAILASVGAIRAAAEAAECALEGHAMGILSSCADFESCVEDPSSSLGGRCAPSGNAYGHGPAKLHPNRKLAGCSGDYPDDCIECTMSDGTTAGRKCDGYDACYGIDPNDVACGACNYLYACSLATGPILEGSCNGWGACAYRQSKFYLLSDLSNHAQPV